MKKIRVWDLPVRLFHWTLTVLIAVAVVTQNIGGNAMEWHFLSGYAALTLILFRILWGMVGTHYARFSSFIHGPSTIIGYMRGATMHRMEKRLGHNPLGSLSVFALLGVVLAQAVSGLFANDDIANEGPLVKFISKELSDTITWFHTAVSVNLLYVLIGLHVTAIAYYYFCKRQNLVKQMITGDHEVPFDAPHTDDSAKTRMLAAVIFLACAAAVYVLVKVLP
jgi:cytochrome b